MVEGAPKKIFLLVTACAFAVENSAECLCVHTYIHDHDMPRTAGLYCHVGDHPANPTRTHTQCLYSKPTSTLSKSSSRPWISVSRAW
jgi:hypothetical protein